MTLDYNTIRCSKCHKYTEAFTDNFYYNNADEFLKFVAHHGLVCHTDNFNIFYHEKKVKLITPEKINESPVNKRLVAVKKIPELYPGTFSQASIRWLIFNEKKMALTNVSADWAEKF